MVKKLSPHELYAPTFYLWRFFKLVLFLIMRIQTNEILTNRKISINKVIRCKVALQYELIYQRWYIVSLWFSITFTQCKVERGTSILTVLPTVPENFVACVPIVWPNLLNYRSNFWPASILTRSSYRVTLLVLFLADVEANKYNK